jgi:hypothetical protein
MLGEPCTQMSLEVTRCVRTLEWSYHGYLFSFLRIKQLCKSFHIRLFYQIRIFDCLSAFFKFKTCISPLARATRAAACKLGIPRHKRSGTAFSGNARVICDAGNGWPRQRFWKSKYRVGSTAMVPARCSSGPNKLSDVQKPLPASFAEVVKAWLCRIVFLASAAKSSSPSEDPVEPNTLEKRSEWLRAIEDPPSKEKKPEPRIKMA